MGRKHTFETKPYRGRHIFCILDAEDAVNENELSSMPSEHNTKVKNMNQLLEKYFCGYKVINKNFPARSKPEEVLAFFKDLLYTLEEGDHITVYFHGQASGNGVEYAWKFNRFPSKPIDAYELIGLSTKVNIDCLFLLDCYIPDRFHDLWEAGEGNMEIIAKGETLEVRRLRQADVNVCTARRTLHVCQDFPQCDSTELDERDFAGFHAPLTLPDLIIKRDTFKSDQKQISAKIRRVDLEGGNHTRRFVIDPEDVRETYKIRFVDRHKVRIDEAGAMAEDQATIATVSEEFEDEALGGMTADEQECDDIFN